jgi:protein-tyrosine-phosphatase
MAAALAKRIFGGGHTIRSAGAETGTGVPAAKFAVAAMTEMGLDITGHVSVDVQDLDSTTFDLIVVFRPSVAESIEWPPGIELSHLDVEDPYGGTLDDYRVAARMIRRGVRRLYVEDAKRRAAGMQGPAGSHLSGIFTRAAKELEKEVADVVSTQLGIKVRKKATLGELAESLKQKAQLESRLKLDSLVVAVVEVNRIWKQVKHQDDPSVSDLLAGLDEILSSYAGMKGIAPPERGA